MAFKLFLLLTVIVVLSSGLRIIDISSIKGFSYVPTPPPTTPIPPPDDVAKMARYIMHSSDWVSIATISTQDSIRSYPFVSLKSVSDGPAVNGTGVPYLYMTDLDVSGKDILTDGRCTIMASLAESDYCKQQNFDPQDPRCAKLIITGTIVKVNPASHEYSFGKSALFEKHPSMKWWPEDHAFYVAKINIEQIEVLDFFGGIKKVTVQEYFNAYNSPNDLSMPFRNVQIIEIDF